MKNNTVATVLAAIIVVTATRACAAQTPAGEAKSVAQAYPRLARDSGKPSLVDFGATGCVACDMMTPVLESLTAKYAGRLNVLFVHVRERQVLAARYGVQTIPVQVLFDQEGNEVFRHVGFLPQEEMERKLTQIGVTP